MVYDEFDFMTEEKSYGKQEKAYYFIVINSHACVGVL